MRKTALTIDPVKTLIMPKTKPTPPSANHAPLPLNRAISAPAAKFREDEERHRQQFTLAKE